MFVSLTGPTGTGGALQTTTYGFYLSSAFYGFTGGPGGVRRHDSLEVIPPGGAMTDAGHWQWMRDNPALNGRDFQTRELPISETEFRQMKDFAEDAVTQAGSSSSRWGRYSPTGNSCVDFFWETLRQGGILSSRPPSVFHGWDLPGNNTRRVDRTYWDYFRRPEFNREGRNYPSFNSPTLDSARRMYQQSQYSSPLILDINGDGIVATRSLRDGVYFDHDANQLAERSGWVGAGDALLVRDLNGNGQVDNGGELFGNHTRTGAGTQTFANGFEALRSLDGNADGFVDSQDATWASLRLWRDDDADAVVSTVRGTLDRNHKQPHPAFMRLAGPKCARRRMNADCWCFSQARPAHWHHRDSPRPPLAY